MTPEEERAGELARIICALVDDEPCQECGHVAQDEDVEFLLGDIDRLGGHVKRLREALGVAAIGHSNGCSCGYCTALAATDPKHD